MFYHDVIKELTEFRTMMESCISEPDRYCDNCAVKESCNKFFIEQPEHLIEVLDKAIEMLREDLE